ncbi:MAG TPA: glycosyltransferase family 2 protein [Bryobacteraceae bacterium]|nr:glycosyltransferase family 2 protein [Bryobacteraceae bacterium]
MLSIVIPIYKNEENLPRLLAELQTFAASFTDELEVVFVVDGSPDGSLDFLRERLPAFPVPTQLIELSRNFGAFSAIGAGLRYGRGDVLGVLAADLQEPLELMTEFHRVLRSGEADVAFGYRVSRADPWWSQMASEWFWRLYRSFVLKGMPKGGIDVFACTRQVRDELVKLPEVQTNLIALLFWLGFRRTFVPYERRARREGRSAWTVRKKLRYAVDSIFNFTDLPIRGLLLIGATACVLAMAAAVVVLVAWLEGKIPVLGYTPLMLVIAFFGGAFALSLGVVGQYIWLSLQNARRRPGFVVRSEQAWNRNKLER